MSGLKENQQKSNRVVFERYERNVLAMVLSHLYHTLVDFRLKNETL